MVAASKILEVLPEGYGYIILVAVDSFFVNMWLSHNVVNARKKYEIPYPKMYSPDNDQFNCVQRAHQNWLEMYPQFLTVLFVGGLQLPKTTAAAGLVYLFGRIVYAQGYYSGDPEKRKRGFFGMLGLLTMLGTTVCTAFHQLNWSTGSFKLFSK
jgi:glutathione S-transferase